MCVYRCIFICICKYRCIRGMSYMYMTLSVYTGVYQDVKCICIYTDISLGRVTCIPGRHYPYIYRCILLRCICIYTDVSVGWVYIQMYPWVTVSGHIHHPDIAPQGSETSASQTHFIPSPCSDNSLRLCRNTTMVTSHWLVLVNFATMMIGRFSLCLKNPAFLGFY